jgi:hypothetical protein
MGAKAVALVPEQQALGLRQRPERRGGQKALHGDGAQIDARDVGLALIRLGRGHVEQAAEQRAPLVQPQKRHLADDAKPLHMRQAEQRVQAVAVTPQQRHVAAGNEAQCRRIGRETPPLARHRRAGRASLFSRFTPKPRLRRHGAGPTLKAVCPPMDRAPAL